MIEPIDMNKIPPVVKEIGIGLQRIIDHLNTEKALPFEACKECIEVSKAIGRKVAEKGDRVVYQCPRCATSMEVDPTGKPSAMGEDELIAFLEKPLNEALFYLGHIGSTLNDYDKKVIRKYLAHAIAERISNKGV